MASERLQKIIARAGITSRRKAEGLIVAGRIAVNGEVVRELGSTADPRRDLITFDGRALFEEENFQEAMDLCESERNYLTNCVQAGLSKLGHSFDTIQQSVREMEEEETVKLFQKIGWLSLIAASAPMMGGAYGRLTPLRSTGWFRIFLAWAATPSSMTTC